MNDLKQILDTIRKELREKDKIHEKAQKEIEDLFKNEIEPRLEKAEVTFAKLKLTAGEFFELKRLFGKSDDQKPV